MKRYRVLVTVMLAAMALIAGCTSSDDAADEPTTAIPATTVAPPVTATTVATTTSTTTTSTTLSPAAAIATVEALQEALNAYDSDAAMALIADGGVWRGMTPGNPAWDTEFTEREAWGHQGTLSDCAATDGVLTCLVTWERTRFGGPAGIIPVTEVQYRFDDQGLVRSTYYENVSGRDDSIAFDTALGAWMATAYPEAYETFYIHPTEINRENCANRIDELLPLIDEFVAQSDVYPLSEGAATEATAPPEATELRLTFVDGGGCTYEGPTELQAGPVRLFYVNESDELSAMNFAILDEGYTAQDVIDQLGPQPSSQPAPSWTKDMGTWEAVAPGRTLSWRFDLEAGVYVMVCARFNPLGGWFGAGLTVEE